MNIQFKQGVLELCLLSLLLDQDYSGYNLVKRLSSTFKLEEGALYPLLRRMVSDGYFTTYIEEITDRRFYKITELGKQTHKTYYSEWYSLINRVNGLIEED